MVGICIQLVLQLGWEPCLPLFVLPPISVDGSSLLALDLPVDILQTKVGAHAQDHPHSNHHHRKTKQLLAYPFLNQGSQILALVGPPLLKQLWNTVLKWQMLLCSLHWHILQCEMIRYIPLLYRLHAFFLSLLLGTVGRFTPILRAASLDSLYIALSIQVAYAASVADRVFVHFWTSPVVTVRPWTITWTGLINYSEQMSNNSAAEICQESFQDT